ncbi:MAG TPA: DUF2059 domain-containing protein [Terracidiphilus sp.]|jgi:hypothetical protein|nr:DUF2059 domain-containing protein [Terracidiphilus sp.]
MISRLRLAVLLGASISTAPAGVLAQAYEVSPNGNVAQEQSAPAIPPEQQATKEQLAHLFDVMRIRDQMQTTRRIVPAMVESQLKEQMQAMTMLSPGSKLTASQRAELDRLLRKYVEKAVNLYPVDEMIADMTGLYQEHLTRDDVDAMTTFYGSPAGQHLLDAQPKIAQEYMPLVMRRTAERTKTLTAEMMKDVAALTPSSSRPQPVHK